MRKVYLFLRRAHTLRRSLSVTLLLLAFVAIYLPLNAFSQNLNWSAGNKFGMLSGGGIVTADPLLIKGSVGAANSISSEVKATGEFLSYNEGTVPEALAELQDNMNTANSFSGTSINYLLAGQQLQEGVYAINGSAVISHDDTLKLQGDENSVFIINVDGDLTLEKHAVISMGDVLPENIYWNVAGNVYIRDWAVAYGVFMAGNSIYKNGPNFGQAALLTLKDIEIDLEGAFSIGHHSFYSISVLKDGIIDPSLPTTACGPLSAPTNASRNFVMNGSFEERADCGINNNILPITRSGDPTPVCHWYTPGLPNTPTGSPDYYNTCNNPNPYTNTIIPQNGVPRSVLGYQFPLNHSGASANGYSGINCYRANVTFGGSDFREYLMQDLPIARRLKPNRHYYGEFYTVLANNSGYSVADLGMFFTVGQPTSISTNPYVINTTSAQIMNNTGIIQDTLNWTRIGGVFQAQGGERYLTIGNFGNTVGSSGIAQASITPAIRKAMGYYFIDGVALYEIPYAGENITVCAGTSVTMGVELGLPPHLLTSSSYAWSSSANPNFSASTLQITETITQTTTYTLVVTIPAIGSQPASVTTTSVTVTVIPTTTNVTLNLVNPHQICGPASASATIQNGQPGRTYEVILTGGSAGTESFGIAGQAGPITFNLPISGEGKYTLTVIDPLGASQCHATLTFEITKPQILGEKGKITAFDGGANFSGTYHVQGPLLFENGIYNMAPGTIFFVEPYAGVAPSNATAYNFEYTNECGLWQTFIVLETATLNVNNAALTIADCGQVCSSGVKLWGGVNLANDATINTTAGSEISYARTAIGSGSINGGVLVPNTNHYYMAGTTIKNCDNGVWDINNQSLLTAEGIQGCTFKENKKGVILNLGSLVNTNFGNGIFTGNTFTGNSSAFISNVNNLNFSGNTFSGNSDEAINISCNTSYGQISVAQNNTIIVPTGAVGIYAAQDARVVNNTITGLPGASMGIRAFNRLVTSNIVSGFDRGIHLEHTNRYCTMEDNTLTNNMVGIYVFTPFYDGLQIIKNRFNLNKGASVAQTGVLFDSFNNTPTAPLVECNTFEAVNTGSAITRGIHVTKGGVDNTGWTTQPYNYISTLGGDGVGFNRRPNGNLFVGLTKTIVNTGNGILHYHIYNYNNGNSSDLKPISQVSANIQGIDGLVSLIESQKFATDACGGGANPGVNTRIGKPIFTNTVTSKTTLSDKAMLGVCYPNPADAKTFVPYSLQADSRNATLEVREITSGRKLQSYEIPVNRQVGEVEIDLRSLPRGLYLYTLIIDGRVIASKLLSVTAK